MSDTAKSLHPDTQAAQMLGHIEPQTKSVVPAIHPGTTYLRNPDLSYHEGRVYTRNHNPTPEPAEQLLTTLEQGDACRLFSSGMAAAATVLQALDSGTRVLMPSVMYWAARGFAETHAVRWGVTPVFLPNDDLPAWEAELAKGGVGLVWLESPSNPDWRIQDIAAFSAAAKRHGAKVVVDNTVATPLLTKPLTLGADISLHSATKYLNGHSDVLAGALVAKDAADPLWQRIDALHGVGGAMLAPFEAWLLQRGMRTLHLRVERASANALKIAEYFHGHNELVEVLYPGLPSHPAHEVAKRQMTGGFSGMLSLRVTGGTERAVAIQGKTKLFKPATSLGGVESLIEHRASVEGPNTPVPGDLLRLSVGIEHVDDLIEDLEKALSETM